MTMRYPPMLIDRKLTKPDFGMYRDIEGWAVWGMFPRGAFQQAEAFRDWMRRRNVVMDIDQIVTSPQEVIDVEAIISDETVAMEFKLTWAKAADMWVP